MRSCAICGRDIVRADICNNCYKIYCPDGVYPEWVKALVQIESHVQRYVNNRETPFSALGLDIQGLPEDETTKNSEL